MRSSRISLSAVSLSLVALCAALSSFAQKQNQSATYFPPPDSSGGWRILKDAGSIRKLAGMDLNRLDQAYELTQRTGQNGALLVVRNGYLVYEKLSIEKVI